jgi:hypothetical protein
MLAYITLEGEDKRYVRVGNDYYDAEDSSFRYNDGPHRNDFVWRHDELLNYTLNMLCSLVEVDLDKPELVKYEVNLINGEVANITRSYIEY